MIIYDGWVKGTYWTEFMLILEDDPDHISLDERILELMGVTKDTNTLIKKYVRVSVELLDDEPKESV